MTPRPIKDSDPRPDPGRLAWNLAIWVLVATMFVARFLVADLPSYWYDELLSVEVYGRWNETAVEAIRYLGDRSVHPPMYQFLLYNWIATFGATEVATRTLSNIFIALATIFLYLTARDVWNERFAFAVGFAFSFMHVPLYYALETRSYAQSIFLATLSSYAFVSLLHELSEDANARAKRAFLSRSAALLIVANAGLLFTHYYNVFFLLAQAAFLAVFVLKRSGRHWRRRLSLAIVVYAIPALSFVALWGGTAVHHFREQSRRLIDDPMDPIEILMTSVVGIHFRGPALLGLLGALLLVGLLGRETWRVMSGVRDSTAVRRAWATLYMAAWMILPLVIMYVAFVLFGAGRYNDRYFTYLAPPLAVLLVFVGYEIVRWVHTRGGNTFLTGIIGTAVALVLLSSLLPQSRDAIAERRYDWRGLTEQVITIIESDPDHDYVVWQSGFREVPLMNHYFERLHPEIRVQGTMTRGEQDSDGPMRIEEASDDISEHDFLVVVFPHIPIRDYEAAMARLNEAYTLHHVQLEDPGRGVVIFQTSGDQ